ncbi:MAG: class II fructose-bisphosphate aldolase [Parcubacteria group bacterium]
MLVHIRSIVRGAVAGKYAVGAFNVNDLEMTQAVLRAADKLKSPVIIQVTESAIAYAGLDELFALIKAGADEIKAPVAIHLDHGHDFELIRKCVASGFSSVMIDGSALPFEENVALTKKVVDYCHGKNVWVQGEIGRLSGVQGAKIITKEAAGFTDPREAALFVEKTGVDAVAVSVGNIHGVQKIVQRQPKKLNLKRLAEIAKIVKIPIVLHGASGFSGAQIKKAIALGVRIANIDSELRLAFSGAERKFLLNNKTATDPRKILRPAIIEMQKTVEKKIKMFACEKKAK